MSLQGLLPLLDTLAGYRGLREALSGPGPLRLSVPDSARSLLLGALQGTLGRPLLVVTPKPEEARRLAEDLGTFCGRASPVLHFPESEALPYERLVVDEATVHGRLQVLAALVQEPHPGRVLRPLVVASVAALMQKTMPREAFTSACHTLRQGQRVRPAELLSRWASLGYTLEPVVEVPGTASGRGGILDVFPPGAPFPARMELFGDTIESIRLFDPATQRSVQPVEEVRVLPAREVLPALVRREDVERLRAGLSPDGCAPEAFGRIQEELSLLLSGAILEEAGFYAGCFNNACLLDYFPADALLVLWDSHRVALAAQDLGEQTRGLQRAKEERGELPQGFPSPCWAWPELRERLDGPLARLLLDWGGTDEGSRGLEVAAAPAYWGRLDSFGSWVNQQAQEGGFTVIVTHHAGRLRELLQEQGLGARAVSSLEGPPEHGSITIVQGYLPQGFILSLPGGSLALITDAELFGTTKQRRPVRRRAFRREAFLGELSPGSYVVHVDHGIGRFIGTARRAGEREEREYLVLEYAEGDKLYVPMEHLDRVSPYFAPAEQPPALTRLGTQEWERTKQRVKESAREMAGELLTLYAARQVVEGHSFPPDTPWQRELEDSFPYVETPDQMAAIGEVKADMEKPRPMDRLVCGDVGYGKTEVALRAAFKAVMEGRQVALLVPTTVLAQQHYATFTERLAPFPVRVEVLSRFRTEVEQQEVIKGLRRGAVDIVIGTHRLLQKDVSFKDLGLVIIDDEQRFGVAQKEHFKRLRREVDVLSMTATPIPRTLYMALSGIRDMSSIETPPEARLPVRVYVSEYSDDLVHEAVLREMDRGGQVFFLHNRIKDIHEWAERLQRLVPHAHIGVGHGRMPEEELERVMADFSQGGLDILVCTTIIEAGLDLPNVNTLIAHRPELLGLAQMYQLRGRVGRGAHRAYAYFLVPRGRRLTEAAERRLKAILVAQELGAGFRIALKDLEIRGAGNLLGPQQSGHVHAVGFDLYCRLLQDAVEEVRAQQEGQPLAVKAKPGLPAASQVLVDLPLAAYIPDEYITDLQTRLGVYQRLATAASLQEALALGEELRDRFGPPPQEVQGLLYAVGVKALAAGAGVEAMSRDGGQLVLKLKEPVGSARYALQQELEAGLPQSARVGQEQVRLELKGSWQDALVLTLERIAAFRERVLPLTMPSQ